MNVNLEELVNKFVLDLTSLLHNNIYNSVSVKIAGQTKTMRLYDNGEKIVAKKKRKVVLCPVRRCKSVAAPVFGMVCKKHKDVPKKVVNEFRRLRKAKAAK